MFRAFLLLLTAAVAVGVGSWQAGIFDSGTPDKSLVGSQVNFLRKPVLHVLSRPSELALTEDGSVEVKADAPAAPGDRVVLRTAGPYGLGFVRVSEALLDGNLRATLRVPGREFLGTFRYWATIPASATYQEGKSTTFTIGIVAAEPPADTCGATQPKRDGSAWVCTYSDEFDGAALDRRFWVPQTTKASGSTSGGGGRYACAEDSPETIAVRDGNLELSLIDRSQGVKCGRNKFSRYAYGQVTHFQTFSQTYGKYEVRAKIPDVQVPGSQQSFWLWPVKNKYGAWPASGEIDFAELYSVTPGVDRPFIHYLPGAGDGDTRNNTHDHCPMNVGQFNTYGVEWSPRQITVLLNGEVCFTNDYVSALAGVHGKNSPFDHPFFLALNQAMGTLGNDYDPALVPDRVTTQIDYVHIWK